MKVGDYVRTNKGEICKVTSVAKDNLGFGNMEFCNTEPFVYGDIIKSSPNIIDLIEYCDIVKYKIDDEEFISEVWGEKNNYFVQNFDVPIDLRDLNIVSIVTKEQFESMEYKIGE